MENTNGAEQQKNAAYDPIDAAKTVSKGRFKLEVPIRDGDRVYDELTYDFNSLTGWELARAMDGAASERRSLFNMTDAQALSLFAAAAAKSTGGLDATDIRERIGAADSIAAIKVAAIFFSGSSLAGSLRITKE